MVQKGTSALCACACASAWRGFFIRFDKCWPAVIHQSHGVVLVYNPDEPAQTKEVELW